MTKKSTSKRKTSKKKKEASKTSKRSLHDYERDKRRTVWREECPVCRLPKDVRDQMRRAHDQKISRQVQLEWLNEELGYKITAVDMERHGQGRHDFR